MPKILYIDRDELFDLYIIKNYSRKDVAKYFNCSESCIKTKLKLYNIPHKTTEAHLDNIVKSNIKNWGCKNVFQAEQIKNKYQETRLNKYGDRYYANKDKQKATCIKKYGSENYMGSKDFVNKARITRSNKYGSWINKSIWHKICTSYNYDNLIFDSSWELALYIYAKDHNEPIIYEPLRIKYFSKDGKEHYYTPDFKYNNDLIEIKADNQVNQNNELLYSGGMYTTDKEIIDLKNKIIKDYNIKILTSKDLKHVFQYINKTYGKNYLKSFKRKER